MAKSKMKSLLESLLDDEDTLLRNTDIMKDFPKQKDCNDYPFPDNNDDNYGYYKWNIAYPDIINKIKGDVLYSYYEPWDDNEGIWKIGLLCSTKSNKNFYDANEFYPMVIDVNSKGRNVIYHDKKEARNLAYELLFNVAKNPDIIKYLLQYKKDYLDWDDLQKEFKNTWIEIK